MEFDALQRAQINLQIARCKVEIELVAVTGHIYDRNRGAPVPETENQIHVIRGEGS
jgi:hypothetical protein